MTLSCCNQLQGLNEEALHLIGQVGEYVTITAVQKPDGQVEIINRVSWTGLIATLTNTGWGFSIPNTEPDRPSVFMHLHQIQLAERVYFEMVQARRTNALFGPFRKSFPRPYYLYLMDENGLAVEATLWPFPIVTNFESEFGTKGQFNGQPNWLPPVQLPKPRVNNQNLRDLRAS